MTGLLLLGKTATPLQLHLFLSLPYRTHSVAPVVFLTTNLQGLSRKHRFQQYLYCCMLIRCCENVFTEPMPRNECFFQSRWLATAIYLCSSCFERIYRNTRESNSGNKGFLKKLTIAQRVNSSLTKPGSLWPCSQEPATSRYTKHTAQSCKEKQKHTKFRIEVVSSEVQTEHLPNTSMECYRCANASCSSPYATEIGNGGLQSAAPRTLNFLLQSWQCSLMDSTHLWLEAKWTLLRVGKRKYRKCITHFSGSLPSWSKQLQIWRLREILRSCPKKRDVDGIRRWEISSSSQ
jgi:hypothetical protein